MAQTNYSPNLATEDPSPGGMRCLKQLLCLLAVLFPLTLFGQNISRTELRNTNTLIDARMALRATLANLDNASNSILAQVRPLVIRLEDPPYNLRPGTNMSGVFQSAVNVVRAAGAGEITLTTPGTYYTASNGVALRPGHSPFASYGLQLTNLTNFTLTLGKGVLITLTNNAQKDHAQGAVHTLHGLYLTNVTIRGEGTISGNAANQPNWTAGYGQSSYGSPIYVEKVKNFRMDGLNLDDHFGNTFNVIDGLDVTTEHISSKNCGEGLQWQFCTNLISRWNKFSNPGNVNQGDAFEYALCRNVLDVGSMAYDNTNNVGGSSMDIYGSKDVIISGFLGLWPFGIQCHADANFVQAENVQVSDSKFIVPPFLRDRLPGIFGNSEISGPSYYQFVNCEFRGGVWGVSSDTNLTGRVALYGCNVSDNSSAGFNIAGGGTWDLHGGNVISNGYGLFIYASQIANTASNGPTLNIHGTHFETNAVNGIYINSGGTNNYHVQGNFVAVVYQANGSANESVDVGTTDNINRNIPVDWTTLKGLTNLSGHMVLPAGRNLVLDNSGGNSTYITSSNKIGTLFNSENGAWRWMQTDQLTQQQNVVYFGIPFGVVSNGTYNNGWYISGLGQISAGGQGLYEQIYVYKAGPSNLGMGLGQSNGVFRIFNSDRPIVTGHHGGVGGTNFFEDVRFDLGTVRPATNYLAADGTAGASGTVTDWVFKNGLATTIGTPGSGSGLSSFKSNNVAVLASPTILETTNGPGNVTVVNVAVGSDTVKTYWTVDSGVTQGMHSAIGTLQGNAPSDTAFASSWNGVTAIPPSKNAVYDWGHLFDTDDDGKVNVLDIGAGIPQTDSGGVVSAIANAAGMLTNDGAGVIGYMAIPSGGGGSAVIPFVRIIDNSEIGDTNYAIFTSTNILIEPSNRPTFRFTNLWSGAWVTFQVYMSSAVGLSVSNAAGTTNIIDWKSLSAPRANWDGVNEDGAIGWHVIRLLCTATNIIGWYDPPFGTANVSVGTLTATTGTSNELGSTWFSGVNYFTTLTADLPLILVGKRFTNAPSGFQPTNANLTAISGPVQTGTMLASNFFAMGISNIVQASGNIAGIGTNNGVLYITNAAIAAGWGFYMTTNGATITMSPTNRSVAIATNATSATLDFSDAANVQEYHVWYHLTTNLVLSPTNPVVGRTLKVFFHTNMLSYDLSVTNSGAAPVSHNFNNPTNGSTAYRKTNTLYMRVFVTAETNGGYTVEQGYYRP